MQERLEILRKYLKAKEVNLFEGDDESFLIEAQFQEKSGLITHEFVRSVKILFNSNTAIFEIRREDFYKIENWKSL